MIKVAIADDHKLFKEGVYFMIDRMDDIQLIYDADDGRELLKEMEENGTPDVLLLDLDMPEMDGIETLRLIRAKYRKVGIIMFMLNKNVKYEAYVRDLEANGCLPKDVYTPELQKAIRTVFEGESYFPNLFRR